MRQGNDEILNIELTVNSMPLNISEVELIEFTFDKIRKIYPAEVAYKDGVFSIPFSQVETFSMGSSVRFESRIKFLKLGVKGSDVVFIDVKGSLSKEIL